MELGIPSKDNRQKVEFNMTKSKQYTDVHMETTWDPLHGESIDKLLEDPDESNFLERITEVFWSLDAFSQSFYPISRSKESLADSTVEIDFIRLERVYKRLQAISSCDDGVFERMINQSIKSIQTQIYDFCEFQFKSALKSWLRVMLMWLSFKELYDPVYESITSAITDYFFELEDAEFYNRNIAEQFFSLWEYDTLLTVVKINQQQLTFLMFDQPDEDSEEMEKVRRYFILIDFLFSSNKHRKHLKINCKEFHIDILNSERADDLPDFYFEWYKAKRRIFSDYMVLNEEDSVFEIDKRNDPFVYLNFPWAFDASSKFKFLTFENHLSRKKTVEGSFRNIFDIIENNFYLQINVNRNTLIEDALNSLNRNSAEFKKPLKVKFKGELGVDDGGVQKEFFQLVIRDLFDVGYGMFEYNEETHLYWFKKDTFESPIKFELAGIILGLAIYNGHILDLHLPLAVYKKLLGREVALEDFAQIDPQVAKSLKAILNYQNEDISEVMGLTFIVEYESWGAKVCEELIPGGKDILITQSNKQEYVDMFVDFMMNISVSKWFSSFKKGFINCCGGEILNILEPEDLEMLIWGSQILDYSKLKQVANYQDGYTEDSQTIQFFWEAIEELNEDEKKKFLFFLTGWDRAPINGLSDLKFNISRHGDNQEHLPSAHTCFNHLLLPDYESKEILLQKLKTAINNAEGFGLF